MGRVIVWIGLAIAALGVIAMLGERFGIRFGRLPGDMVFRGRNTTFYFPIVTCLLLSVLLTLISWLFSRR
jgi:Protein of unknown function (DUF2905)